MIIQKYTQNITTANVPAALRLLLMQTRTKQTYEFSFEK